MVDGEVRNASFTDYLIPTVLDMPPVELDVLELADPGAPYGLRGVGEPPTISSTPAIVAALRAATGAELRRVPVRPDRHRGALTLPVPPAELSAHYTIAGPDEALDAARAVADPSGIAHEAGPGETLLSGSRPRCSARSATP